MVFQIQINSDSNCFESDGDPFQDHFDGNAALGYPLRLDHYFDDYDFEDRPDIRDSPRLVEFDANS
jgi:hypothetical protein